MPRQKASVVGCPRPVAMILRSATAVTIEMSYMSVLHEIDALEMAGIDPLHAVGFPRLVGITTAIVSLVLVFDQCLNIAM